MGAKKVPANDPSKRDTPGSSTAGQTAASTGARFDNFGLPAGNPHAAAGVENLPQSNSRDVGKRTTGYAGDDQVNPDGLTSGVVPPAGSTETPVGGGRHAGYVVERAGVVVEETNARSPKIRKVAGP